MGLVIEKKKVMENLSMEDAYGSHEPSSTVNRFTSVSKENTLHISPGQEKSPSTLQESWATH